MRVGILGAGPAGLFAAWLLHQRGIDVQVLEARSEVGGISRSFRWHGFTCDLGAHRLFTQDESGLHHLLSIVPMGRHIRRSRIHFRGKWIRDPVNIIDVLRCSPPADAARIVAGYLARPRPSIARPALSFDEYVEQKYGAALNRFFFRPYTERMFGRAGEDLSADWARQKVRVGTALDFARQSSKRNFGYFYYPIQGGFGAISEMLSKDLHSCVQCGAEVCALETEADRVEAVVYRQDGQHKRAAVDQVISTLPLTALGQLLNQPVHLAYQGVSFVYLLVDRPLVSDDHWRYFMSPEDTINRLVEFKNLSAVEQPTDRTVVCAEVTRQLPDRTERVIDDMVRCRLVRRDEVLDTLELREEHGYAIYDRDYAAQLASAQEAFGRFDNLHRLGRSASFQHLEIDEIWADAVTLATRLAPVRAPTAKGGTTVATTPAEPSVCAVILTYNHYEDTRECLHSLQQSDYPNLDIVVVDNGSSDGTPEQLRKEFPEVIVIETGRNLGVPWGYNVGFAHALRTQVEYILMLNNDTTVAPDMLRRLVESAQGDPDAGILMPKVLYYDRPDRIWSAGGRYRVFPPAIIIVGQDRPSAKYEKPFQLEYALSCGLLIHRRAFERAGLFDPGYFFYFDDWDFSARVRAHGLNILLVPQAKMWHKVSQSTRESGKSALFYTVWGESSTRFYRRHGRPVALSLPIHIGYIMLRELIKGNGRMLGHFFTGVRQALTKPLGPIPTKDDMVLPPSATEDG
jgi:GT2 family glycosyltransferase/protoporphyrinogen oxidase